MHLNKNTGGITESKWRSVKRKAKMFDKTGKSKPKKIAKPSEFFKLACEYFEAVDSDPFDKKDFIRGGEKAGEIIKLSTPRPYSWSGFEAFLVEKGIINKLDDYRFNTYGNYEDFVDVVRVVDRIMYTQKFEGAAVGAFNANIISRDLQLAEMTVNHISGNIDTKIDYEELSDEALEEIAKQIAKGNDSV